MGGELLLFPISGPFLCRSILQLYYISTLSVTSIAKIFHVTGQPSQFKTLRLIHSENINELPFIFY